ncbi:MAG: PHP domain-containing protein, partial [Desulfobacterales bacterium]|nr:PHP domain-containing protein [Desulfobacterales bacterium]
MGIDLHIHSTASDGSLTPAEILDQAQKLNLAAIAITDHDS